MVEGPLLKEDEEKGRDLVGEVVLYIFSVELC